MNELALFAGAGGGILGGHLLGWRCVCAVECEAYAAGVLLARQNDGILPPFPVWDDVRTFDGRPWRGVVDVVSGGFPCQDISSAGKGAGITGERSGLWKEFKRIIGEVGPRFVLVENSPVLTSRGLGVVLGDLAALGYDARWGVLGAYHAGAPHKRDRIWIVADAEGFGEGSGEGRGWDERWPEFLARPRQGCNANDGGEDDSNADTCGQSEHLQFDGDEAQAAADGNSCGGYAGGFYQEVADGGECGEAVADTDEELQHGRGDTGSRGWAEFTDGREAKLSDADEAGCAQQRGSEPDGAECFAAECGGWWVAEPDVGRVADGVAARVDRLAALGNGQVPAVARCAWEILHREMKSEPAEAGTTEQGTTNQNNE